MTVYRLKTLKNAELYNMLVGCTVGGANAIHDSANHFNIVNIILLLQVLTHTCYSPDVLTGVGMSAPPSVQEN